MNEQPICPICPVCGWECMTIVMNVNRDVIGCDVCLDIVDAEMWEEERKE